MDRASDYESEGRRFESCRARHLFLGNTGREEILRISARHSVCQAQVEIAPKLSDPFKTPVVFLLRKDW